jgi:hypothetical protein
MARTQEFSDDFNRANSSNLGSDWTENVGDAAITSNKLTITTAAANLTYNTNPTTKDQYAKITLSTEDNNNQIRLRNDATETTHYRYNFRGNNSDTVMLRVLSGSGTLVSSQGGHTYANGDTISAEVETTDASTVVIRTFINGSEHDSYSDTDANRIDSNGSVTLNFASTSVVLDDFEGGILSSGTNFTNYASITIDNTKVSGSSNHTDFPVLISGIFDGTGGEPDLRTAVNDGNIQNTDATGGASGALTVPADLEFWSDNAASGTQYDHEVIAYDGSTGEFKAYVRVPTLQYSTDTTFYMHYNDSAVTTSQENVTSLWSNLGDGTFTVEGVWHMAEASGTRYDSTSNNNDLTDNNTCPSVAGKIYKAADFSSANSEYLSIADNASNSVTGDITVSMWYKADSSATNFLIGKNAGGSNRSYWLNSVASSNYLQFNYTSSGSDDSTRQQFSSNNSTITQDGSTWNHIHVVTDVSAEDCDFYVDGSAVGSSTSINGSATSIFDGTAPLEIGSLATFSVYSNIQVEEARLYSGKLSSDWIATEYNNQNSPSTFYTMGSEQGDAGSASASPSGSPSSSPSSSPSEGTPSSSPSEGTPSSSPSEGTPSSSPSATPSSSPSSSPSEGTPSNSPSEGTPSSSPSEGTPSNSPSEGTPSSSPSASPSGSPSSSPSFGTPSVTPSSSPSSSPSEGTPSTSPSSSPTPGWISYSREAVQNLVNNTNDLSIIYSESEIDDVSTENGVYVGVEATDDLFAMHQFKEYVGSANTCTVTWKGQTTCPTFLSGARVYLCVFNLNDGAWEIIDSENAADENTQFTLTYYFDDLTNYKDASNVVSFYVRQYNAI